MEELACSVCGKPATGTHYMSVACNGCRSFFRRSVAFNRTYNCKGMSFDLQECFERHRCKRCRLSLCLSSGMNPDAVQKDEQCKKEKCNAEDIPDSLIVHQPQQIENKFDKMMINLIVMDEAHDRLRISSYCPKLLAGLTIDDFFNGPSKLGMPFEPMRTQAYEAMSAQLVTVEVVLKYKICMDLSNFDYSKKKLWMFQDIVYSIEFIKALPIYHLLDDCSQRTLIASALACSNFTSAFYSYSHHSDRTYYPDGGTMSWNSEIQAQAPGSTLLHTGIIAAIREAQLDKREYILLKMILVLNPCLFATLN
ncbi:hypothetical protein PMAYCL1PPCAC_05938 [Pristionchus mayeri]|uniref:Nuclear receptor domain-containing protein n=1 Tax=Pristionchus mayeri TaxID=1317129 RepID=A0AAN4ZC01_9BILA|nr:hypothetical protein PMAYCL1PPCAC_05938 [Pristionchus mayeri]